nr:hypothetical protein Iba_chr05dCG13370 [Ipomoea batatas]GMD63970.1 hypothetical protein Iba_scaffold49223CG0010 [Ipomoea batatas]
MWLLLSCHARYMTIFSHIDFCLPGVLDGLKDRKDHQRQSFSPSLLISLQIHHRFLLARKYESLQHKPHPCYKGCQIQQFLWPFQCRHHQK